MTISFDLDDTLISGTKQFDTEKQTAVQRLLGLEKIRLGTIALFKELRAQGHRICIYTTSFRSEGRIKATFYRMEFLLIWQLINVDTINTSGKPGQGLQNTHRHLVSTFTLTILPD